MSLDGTHHILDDHPLYLQRFDDVLKFHAPGLAPVLLAGEAWHIQADGSDAYTRRFIRTFGFYAGKAAVIAEEGWHHLQVDGNDAYPERYAWCGNYQDGRCVVRDKAGDYYHLNLEGEPAYEARWRYAGDYRDGVGVVQNDVGRSTHISLEGELLHNKWFVDLDIFHKGFARAQDQQGWCHIDKLGQAIYTRRFASIEPFYNGQARVALFDGALEIIDESGQSVVELRTAGVDKLA